MKKKFILYFFVFLVLLAGFAAWKFFGPTVNAPVEKYFYIPTGSTYAEVKESLESRKVISSDLWFDKVAKYVNYNKSVKPGRYKITEGMSVVNLVRMLKAGKQSPVNLTIIKIRTKEDLAKKIGDNFECDSASVIHFLNNTDSLSQYGLDTNTVMTAIIPDTYSMIWNNTPSRIFKKLYAGQEKFWTEERKHKAALLGFSEEEVYTLASIVEEETNKEGDKGNIASVYINRMKEGMKLAADPTIKFALKNFGLKRIYEAYTRIPSPYNTYLNKGLPPGPICTPSVKTIDAVLDVPHTDYMYFIAKPNFSGYSDFTSNYDEHMKHAKIYHQWLDSLFKARKITE